MSIVNKSEPIVLFIGDIVALFASLWVMLFVRYLEAPSKIIFFDHLTPFSILFFVSVLIFFIAGLYERHTSIFNRYLPRMLVRAQLINAVISIVFFYFIPYFGITPKTNLFIYIVLSVVFLTFWRLYFFPHIRPGVVQNAILIGRGEEIKELYEEINKSSYGFNIKHSLDLDNSKGLNVEDDIVNQVNSKEVSLIIIDTRDDSVIPLLPHLYKLIFSNITFVDMHEVYESIFGRVPISSLRHSWFLENVRSRPHIMYDGLKRLTDFIIALSLGVLSLVFYPFVFLAIKLDGSNGPIFIRQNRIGINNKVITILKFRTMSFNDNGNADEVSRNEVTKVGYFLRKSRIDELPQLWNVVSGSLSLIGPRPELNELVKKYADEVPYYNVRHLIKPGLSGWAQMKHENHPHHGTDVVETRNKLSYDLYYIKNRSFLLDIKIALQTIQILLSQKGR